MKAPGWVLPVLCGTSLSIAFLTGCGQDVADRASAFQSAPPEMKNLWDSAAAAMTTNNYAVALLQLRQLRSLPALSAEQAKVVDATSTSINDRMYEAANKGDPAAKQALDDLRKAMGR